MRGTRYRTISLTPLAGVAAWGSRAASACTAATRQALSFTRDTSSSLVVRVGAGGAGTTASAADVAAVDAGPSPVCVGKDTRGKWLWGSRCWSVVSSDPRLDSPSTRSHHASSSWVSATTLLSVGVFAILLRRELLPSAAWAAPRSTRAATRTWMWTP